MKTTVEISDALFESARRLATRRGCTMRALIEEGLRAVLQAHRNTPVRFALRDASIRGDGLVPGVELGDWSQIRTLIYDETPP
ncbi:MAG: type II toxin-antitoxin system VapB family antitoxin [Gemmatimonas sp.]